MSFIKTYINNIFGNDDRDSEVAPIRTSSSWAPVVGVCVVLIILGIVAAVIILSLFALYLPNKGDDLVVYNNKNVRYIDLSFATNLPNNAIFQIANYDSLGQQFGQYLGYTSPVLTVRAASFSANTIIPRDAKKRKRQTSTELSCDTSINGTNSNGKKDSNLGIEIYINSCPKNKCKSDLCVEKCVKEIKLDIQTKLSSAPIMLSITAADGEIHLVSNRFCSFQRVISVPPTCSDGIQNQDETDVDCGGSCNACPVGKMCKLTKDCANALCTNAVCQSATCCDGLINGAETDVDCGGGTCLPCADTKACSLNTDCVSTNCAGLPGTCQANTWTISANDVFANLKLLIFFSKSLIADSRVFLKKPDT